MHDAVARGDDIDILERFLGPVDEIEPVGIAPILDRAILVERLAVEPGMFHGQAVIDDQLGRHDRIDLGRVAALIGDRIAQASQVDKSGQAQNIVTDDARGIPGKVAIAAPVGNLDQRVVKRCWIAAANQLFCQHARHIGQRVVNAGTQRLDRGARVEMIEIGAGQRLAVSVGHVFHKSRQERRVAVNARTATGVAAAIGNAGTPPSIATTSMTLKNGSTPGKDVRAITFA